MRALLFGLIAIVAATAVALGQTSTSVVVTPSINPIVLAPGQSIQLLIESAAASEKAEHLEERFVTVSAPGFRPTGMFKLQRTQQITLTVTSNTSPGLYAVVVTAFGQTSETRLALPVTIGAESELDSLKRTAVKVEVLDQPSTRVQKAAVPSALPRPLSSNSAPVTPSVNSADPSAKMYRNSLDGQTYEVRQPDDMTFNLYLPDGVLAASLSRKKATDKFKGETSRLATTCPNSKGKIEVVEISRGTIRMKVEKSSDLVVTNVRAICGIPLLPTPWTNFDLIPSSASAR